MTGKPDPYVSPDDVDLSPEEAAQMRADRMADDQPPVTKPTADQMLAQLKIASAWITEELKQIGGCDHAVNICVCGDYAMLDDLDRTIAHAEGRHHVTRDEREEDEHARAAERWHEEGRN